MINNKYKLNPDLRSTDDPALGEYVPINTQIFYQLKIAKSKLSDDIGLGTFALENIRKDSVIIIGGGQLTSDSSKFSKDKDYAGVFNEKYLMAPLDYDNPSPNWLMNHSCEPNVKIIGGLIVISRIDIIKGDELTVDYGIIAAGDFDFKMNCKCNSTDCRQQITNNDWKNKKLFDKYYDEWAPFIQKRGVNN
ncbi:MAG: SET domain-containing protein [Pseudomonadota bacterium]